MSHITQFHDKLNGMTGYQIFAYDKDNDRLDLLCDLSNLVPMHSNAIPTNLLQVFADLVKTERLRAPNGEPYDWVELYLNGSRLSVA